MIYFLWTSQILMNRIFFDASLHGPSVDDLGESATEGAFRCSRTVGQPPCFDTRRLTSILFRNLEIKFSVVWFIQGLVPIWSAPDSLQYSSTPFGVDIENIIRSRSPFSIWKVTEITVGLILSFPNPFDVTSTQKGAEVKVMLLIISISAQSYLI